jgi:hypothetical protein
MLATKGKSMGKFCNAILLLCLSALSSISEAGDLTYDCVIKNIYDIDDAGILVESGWQSEFQSNKFTVSRETGKVLGETLTTVLAKNTRVINFGSEDYSFKTVAEF